MNIDEAINTHFEKVAGIAMDIVFFAVPVGPEGNTHDLYLILVWLVAAALFFTFYLGFVNFRGFRHGVRLLTARPKGDDEGQISSFQALATSLSGTVGLGNIAGVAVAVSVGGPGALLWMAAMALFGMSTKFAEVMLGVKYRRYNAPGHPRRISGGPMYYLRDGLASRNLPLLGGVLAAIFSIACVLASIGAGNLFQVNQAYMQFINVTGGEDSWLADKGWLFGALVAVLVGIVIVGGIRSIAAVTSKLVPIRGGLYLAGGLVIIAMHLPSMPGALGEMISGAFTLNAGFGGLLGALLAGVQRATFSNEAGLGTAAIAHSTARAEPVPQGLIAMLGPVIDTMLICMVTGLVIVITGAHEAGDGMEGVSMTSRAFESGIPGAQYFIALTVFLFAFSTIITWSYYGVKALTYLFGENDYVQLAFRLVYCALAVVGASADLKYVILFTDAMAFTMAIPNIIGLYVLAPEIKQDLNKYLQGAVKKGILEDPV